MRARSPETVVSRLPRRGLQAFVALFALAFATLAPAPARAAPPTYTAEAPVDSQSDDDRLEALKIALANVIIDQTGDAGALSRSDVAAQLAKADRYVLQFKYRQNAGAADTGAPRLTQPKQARGDGMLVKLSLATDLKHFLDAVTIERQLSVVNGSPPVDGIDATLALGP